MARASYWPSMGGLSAIICQSTVKFAMASNFDPFERASPGGSAPAWSGLRGRRERGVWGDRCASLKRQVLSGFDYRKGFRTDPRMLTLISVRVEVLTSVYSAMVEVSREARRNAPLSGRACRARAEQDHHGIYKFTRQLRACPAAFAWSRSVPGRSERTSGHYNAKKAKERLGNAGELA
jgi:hypothetical protein